VVPRNGLKFVPDAQPCELGREQPVLCLEQVTSTVVEPDEDVMRSQSRCHTRCLEGWAVIAEQISSSAEDGGNIVRRHVAGPAFVQPKFSRMMKADVDGGITTF